jgi:hypothetical protein
MPLITNVIFKNKIYRKAKTVSKKTAEQDIWSRIKTSIYELSNIDLKR